MFHRCSEYRAAQYDSHLQDCKCKKCLDDPRPYDVCAYGHKHYREVFTIVTNNGKDNMLFATRLLRDDWSDYFKESKSRDKEPQDKEPSAPLESKPDEPKDKEPKDKEPTQ